MYHCVEPKVSNLDSGVEFEEILLGEAVVLKSLLAGVALPELFWSLGSWFVVRPVL